MAPIKDPASVEQFLLKGCEVICRIFWYGASPAVQAKYPRYHESEKFVIGLDDETALAYRMAMGLFEKLNLRRIKQQADRPNDLDQVFREYALFACKLGAPANIGDVEYYFVRKCEEAEHQRKWHWGLLQQSKPPEWAVQHIEERGKRVKRLEELRAPSQIIDNEYEMYGGRGDISVEERCWAMLRRREDKDAREVQKFRWILEELGKGVTTPALLFIGEELEAAAACYDDAKDTYWDSKAEDLRPKNGTLSTLVRMHRGKFSLDTELFNYDYLLCQSLTSALEPQSGRA